MHGRGIAFAELPAVEIQDAGADVPGFPHDAGVSHPQQMLEHRDWLESTLRERDSVPEAAENEIDAATQRRLEALGYIE